MSILVRFSSTAYLDSEVQAPSERIEVYDRVERVSANVKLP